MAPPSLTAVGDALNGEVVEDGSLVKPCSISIQYGKLQANGQPFLVDVPTNIVATPASIVVASPTTKTPAVVTVDADTLYSGCFVGFDVPDGSPKSWVAAPLGRLLGIPFMSIFRFKVCWN